MITTGTIKNTLRTFVLIIVSLAVQTAWGAYNPITPLPTDTWTNHKATAFSSGSGTQADPWVITTADQLAFLAYQVTNNKSINSVACKSAYYSLKADIDLKDNVKACWIDEHLKNIPKVDDHPEKVCAQLATYAYIKNNPIE